jgi:cytochrome c biogenesis protein CcmG/thiol:disulfide interchange protein DsbE
MTKKKYRRQRKQPNPMVSIGIGLFLIVIAVLFMAVPKSQSKADAPSSVVPIAVNFAAPELALQNISGETKSLADYRSDVVLVNNWATWCPPCKAEMPTLAAYYNEHNAAGFMIIAIEAGDAIDGVSQFAQSYNLKFQVWLDPNGEALKVFGNGSLPNSYVIDRTGTVRYAWTGEINKAMLEKYITPLLMEN